MATNAPTVAVPPRGILSLPFLVSALATLPLIGACSDGTGPSDPAAQVEHVRASALVGTVGEELPEPLRVRVSDARGRRLAGIEVEFLAAPGGGSMRAADAAGPDAAARTTRDGRGIVVTTDSRGEARAVWELSYRAGSQAATVTVSGVAPLELTATARPGPPAILEVAGGHGQIGLAGAPLTEPLVARLRDRFGNRVPDAAVAWVVISGSGQLSSTASHTDASGEASVQLNLGPDVHLHTVRASHGAIEPVEFQALALTAVAGDDAGDTFTHGISGDVVLPDVIALGAGWDGDQLVVGLVFDEPMAVAAAGQPNSYGGVLDLDIDLDASTGVLSAVDVNRPGEGSTGMGVDLFVDLVGGRDGLYRIMDPNYQVLGIVAPSFHGRLVTFVLPSDVIGTGPLSMAAVVATYREPTDVVPEDGAVVVGAR